MTAKKKATRKSQPRAGPTPSTPRPRKKATMHKPAETPKPAAAPTPAPAAKPTTGTTVKIAKGRVIFTFTDMAAIRGPFKFYVTASGTHYTIDSAQITQDYAANGKSVDASFDHALIDNATRFEWYAYTVTPGENHALDSGSYPQ